MTRGVGGCWGNQEEPPPHPLGETGRGGAYLGHGSGAEPAGRWRAACCRTAPRGWGCCGRFHCLQAEAQTAESRGSRAEHFKRKSLFGDPVSPACGPPAPARHFHKGPRLVNPTSCPPSPRPRGEGTAALRAEHHGSWCPGGWPGRLSRARSPWGARWSPWGAHGLQLWALVLALAQAPSYLFETVLPSLERPHGHPHGF